MARGGVRVPRAQQGRQDDHPADAGRAGQADRRVGQGARRPAGSPLALARTGVLIEAPRFIYLSGRDNLRVVARYAGVPDERVEAVLDTVDLAGRGGDYAGYSWG